MNINDLPRHEDIKNVLLDLYRMFVVWEDEEDEDRKKREVARCAIRIGEIKTILAIEAHRFKWYYERALNPILHGMLDLCLELDGRPDEDLDYVKVYRKAYDKFQTLLQEYPFEGNEKMYLDSGCELIVDSEMATEEGVWESDKVANYPDAEFELKCFSSFTETIKKQLGDDNYDPHMAPCTITPITKDQLTRIHDACPEKFEGNLERLYQSIVASPSEFLQ